MVGMLAAGCAERVEPTPVDAASADAVDAATDEGAVDLDAAEAAMVDARVLREVSTACPATETIRESFAMAPPAAAQDVCTQEDLGRLLAVFTAFNPSIDRVREALSPACAACAVTAYDAAAWGPFVADPVFGTTVFPNDPGCMTLEGARPACARALNQWGRCTDVACAGCLDGTRALACYGVESNQDTAHACMIRLNQYLGACSYDQATFDRCYRGGGAMHLGGLLQRFCGPRAR